MKQVLSCLICGSNEFEPFLQCKDYTVSGEIFSIQQCRSCGFKFTSPRPEDSVLGKYYKSEEYISHSDSKKGLINKIYRYVREYTIVKKLQLVIRYAPKRDNILDYGCGTGSFLKACVNSKWNSFGLEPDDDARTIAITQSGLEVYKNIEEASNGLKKNSLDAITLWHVLEHVSDTDSLFDFFNNVLSRDGVLVIAVPNCASYDASYYGKYWAAFDLPRHLYHFTPKDIESLLKKKGFTLVKVLPMVFDSYYVSILSEKYKNDRTNLFSAFWRGLISNIRGIRKGNEFSSQIYVFKRS